jgi:hypothetical protein
MNLPEKQISQRATLARRSTSKRKNKRKGEVNTLPAQEQCGEEEGKCGVREADLRKAANDDGGAPPKLSGTSAECSGGDGEDGVA